MLSVESLAVEIEGKEILKKTTLAVRNTEILAVLGRSGSGKSTLLKAIAGLIEPSNGSAIVDGERVKKPSQQLIPGHQHIKIVRQDNPLFPNISLRENIAYSLRFFEKQYQKSRVEKLLSLTSLQHVADQKPRNVSEGEQQRAVIATALADEPKVLLLDEPYSNLDFGNKKKLKEEIRNIISEENMACVFVTHDIDDVFGNADRLAILKSGKIVQIGKPENVYLSPKTKYVAEITGELNKHKASDFNLEGNFLYTRPQHLEINQNGAYKAVVKEVIFRGNFWEIKLGNSNSIFSVYQMHPLEEGAFIRFDMNRTSAF
ncbi:iron(III) transport system ATP-binding protein [Spirosomataceae bacterium TFI 002]|nr:iron(III) transport system ATP-binding protein [Spirosomataceae bacterium TFI 002]